MELREGEEGEEDDGGGGGDSGNLLDQRPVVAESQQSHSRRLLPMLSHATDLVFQVEYALTTGLLALW